GKIFQLTHQSLAIDFGLREHGYLFMSVEPAAPRLYLIKRRVRDLEKASVPTTQFALNMRKELAQKKVTSVEKLQTDRVVTMKFEGSDDLGQRTQRTLIAQLTGRSANLFLLNDEGVITGRLKETKGVGQTIGEKYQPPDSGATHMAGKSSVGVLDVSDSKSYSEQLDQHYSSVAERLALDSQIGAARAQLQKEISRGKKLLKKLERDLEEHSGAEQHKQIGDLLLANVGTAKRVGSRLKLTDYFAEGAPEIEIEIDENRTIPEEASRRFALYSRSKRARVQIANRIKQVKAELADLEIKREHLETSPGALEDTSASIASAAKAKATATKSRESRVPGARRYLSSDGYEILVGRAARDNDNLTFKIAKPSDRWLHAADYPGSHVIVRNPTRKEIPHRTLVEAAQLAGYFSQASKDPKVDVHYTQRKFLSKPKGSAPGLVRMSRFKNVIVKPAEAVERML
ncbi:MAG TPA: NFACT RNA binding domain-containing protein, partial [Pyrinomonadaceae bacterium]|nr:NFACT RNA binding domain-containing protein [Pyrinomonadaceae bacterium]